MKVLVTGAGGFVGGALCRELASSGYEVTALVRSRAPEKLVALGAHIETADITDSAAVRRIVPGHQVIFHIAALYREAKFPDEEYFRVNVGGTKNLVEAAQASGVTRFIHCSTIGVHSHIAFPPADEEEPYAPTDVYQQSKVEAEQFVRAEFRRGTLRGCVIRPAMIWGPGDTRFLKMFRGIARRRLPLIGRGDLLTHWILVGDLARAFRLASETERTNGEVYIIAGATPVPLSRVYEEIARHCGVKLLPFRVPVRPLQIVGSVVEAICRPFGIEPPLHRRRADFFIKQRAFSTAKARAHFGFTPAHTFEEEVALIADWYRAQGWL